MLIYGQIADAVTGAYLQAATVSIPARGLNTITDNEGYFEFNDAGILPGDNINISFAEYTPQTIDAQSISDNLDNTILGPTILLTPNVTTLPGVTVTAAMKKPATNTAPNYWPLLLGGALILTIKDKKKKVGSVKATDVKEWLPLIAIGAGVIILWKPLGNLLSLIKGVLNAPFAVANYLAQGIGNLVIPEGTIDEFHTMFNLCKVSDDSQAMEDLINSNPRFSDLEKANLIGQLMTPKNTLSKTIAAVGVATEINAANHLLNSTNQQGGVDNLITGAIAAAAG